MKNMVGEGHPIIRRSHLDKMDSICISNFVSWGNVTFRIANSNHCQGNGMTQIVWDSQKYDHAEGSY